MNVSGSNQNQELIAYQALLEEARRLKGVSLGRDAWRRLRKNPAAMFSLGFLLLLIFSALFTPLWPLEAPQKIETARALRSPTWEQVWNEEATWADELGKVSTFSDQEIDLLDRAGFGKLNALDRLLVRSRVVIFGRRQISLLCGTDLLGRDLLARLFWGARVSITVGIVATLVSLWIGVSYGAVSGYLGGWIDNLLMRIVDVLYSIPFIYVVIFLITIIDELPVFAKTDATGQASGPSFSRITLFFFVLGAIYWLTMARVVRGQVLSLKQEQFVEAARTIGASTPRIIFSHLVPNLWSVVIVYLTLTIPRIMLFEAFLSFLGLGVEPPDVSWGLLANEAMRVINPIRIEWWLVLFPNLALGLTLFSLNFLGDGLRDALDPRMKNR